MNKLNVQLAERGYPIYITTGYAGFVKCIAPAKPEMHMAIITDENVDKCQAEEFIRCIENEGFKPVKYVMKAGEDNKTFDTVKEIYTFLLDNNFDRHSTLVALGGGVVGDITGFAAATYMRGIDFIQVPTTLLAQADSSVGGKVGVDFYGSKNIIGSFYQPKMVYINVDSLKTLPLREMRSGLAEVIKHGLIKDPEFFEYIDYNIERIYNYNTEILKYMAKVNCSIKSGVVEKDEKESGLRAILNFGHTIGHAIESISNFKLLHGECVSIGIAGAFRISCHMGMLKEETVQLVEAMLDKAGLPIRYPEMNIDNVYDQMFRDKKIKNGKLKFVLPKRIGEVLQCTVDDPVLIKMVLRELKG